MPADIARLKELAEKATPGQWVVLERQPDAYQDYRDWFVGFSTSNGGKWYDEDSTSMREEDATFIAACSPDVILDLIARAESVGALCTCMSRCPVHGAFGVLSGTTGDAERRLPESASGSELPGRMADRPGDPDADVPREVIEACRFEVPQWVKIDDAFAALDRVEARLSEAEQRAAHELAEAERLGRKWSEAAAEHAAFAAQVDEAASATGPSAVEEVLAVYMAVRTLTARGFSCDVVDEVRRLSVYEQALVTAAIVLEVLAGQIASKPYAELSERLQREIEAAALAARAALTTEDAKRPTPDSDSGSGLGHPADRQAS